MTNDCVAHELKFCAEGCCANCMRCGAWVMDNPGIRGSRR